VVLSNSRGPETLAALVAELGPHARAATPAEAAAAGDVVVVTVPLHAYRAVPGPLAGKVVIDTNNYYPGRDGSIAELDDGSTTSSELLAAHLPDSHVVKAFNNIRSADLLALARPAGRADRSALPVAGDSRGGEGDARSCSTGSATTSSTRARSPRAAATSPTRPPTARRTSARRARRTRPRPTTCDRCSPPPRCRPSGEFTAGRERAATAAGSSRVGPVAAGGRQPDALSRLVRRPHTCRQDSAGMTSRSNSSMPRRS
jgi:hypothetical protein